MNKKKIIIIAIGAVLLLSLIVGIKVINGASPYEKQVKLAYKLLSDGKYEEAILNFDKAIEIDNKHYKAYIGKADVYVARCDENVLTDIQSVLEIAYSKHYNDKKIVESVIRLADDLMSKGKGEIATALLEFGYELTKDRTLSDYKLNLFNKFAGDFLVDLYTMFKAGDKESVKKEIQSEKYLEFVKLVDDIDYKYIYFPEKNKSQTGKGVALYYVDTESYGKVFVYYGDFENGKRTGNGIWAGANGKQYYWFEGQWSDDVPNGDGELSVVRDESKLNKESGHSYCIKNETKGTFKNGKHHGLIYETWYMDNGNTMVWNPITAIDGVYQEMASPPEDIINSDYAQENYAEGNYLVSLTESGSDLWNNGDVNYILGFK